MRPLTLWASASTAVSSPTGGVGAAAVALSLAYGLVVGASLGLTGGGGSIFAVPLLVYGLGVRTREAVGVSLAVGATALVGGLRRLAGGEVEVRTGPLFAAAGVIWAPAGRCPEDAARSATPAYVADLHAPLEPHDESF